MASGPRRSDAHRSFRTTTATLPRRRTPEPASMPEGGAAVKSCGGGACMPTIHPCGPSPLRSKAFRFDRRTRCAAAAATFTATRSSTRPRASSGRARSRTRTRSSATRTSAACRRSTSARSTSTCCSPPSRPAASAPIRATRKPLPMCRAEVSSCYTRRENELGCVNPEFFELPLGAPAFRVLAQALDT